jgi:hypothetical protein
MKNDEWLLENQEKNVNGKLVSFLWNKVDNINL